MISDDDVKRLFHNGQRMLAQQAQIDQPAQTQFYRGIGPHLWKDQHSGGCLRHMAIFNNFNIIPKYCFDCFKILIIPNTVIELFKLMVVFEKLKLSNDNSRKCMIECRDEIAGTYKGYIYCRNIKEGNDIVKNLEKIVPDDIANNISVTLKRGCSEFSLAYPEFSKINKTTAIMPYKNEWQKTEELADQKLQIKIPPPASDTFNHPGYTTQDAQIMLIWLQYAATIGDLSYLQISGQVLQPIQDVKRTSQFKPVKKNQIKTTTKTGRNAPCTCGSGKKYKHCCSNK